MTKRFSPTIIFNYCVLSLGICLTTPAFADNPWLQGPSGVAIGERVIFTGGGFAPGWVKIVVTPPSKQDYSQVVGVNTDGSLAVQIGTLGAGTYTVRAVGSDGKVIQSTSLIVN